MIEYLRKQFHKRMNGCDVIRLDEDDYRTRVFTCGSYTPAEVYVCCSSFLMYTSCIYFVEQSTMHDTIGVSLPPVSYLAIHS